MLIAPYNKNTPPVAADASRYPSRVPTTRTAGDALRRDAGEPPWPGERTPAGLRFLAVSSSS
jgi:hypothetical protein